MKCLLINPSYRGVAGKAEDVAAIIPPTGLAYIAAVLLKHSFAVKILDANAERLDDREIKEAIRREAPTVVGITSTTPCISEALAIARLAKEVNKDPQVIMGGPHPSILPHEIIEDENVDIVVRGEGEYTMLELMTRISNGRGFDDIVGITYQKNGKIVDNPPRPLIANLDELPYPPYHLLLPMDRYYSAQTKKSNFCNILTSRGCPFQCNYCNKSIFGSRFRARSVENIIGEIKYLVRDYDIHEFQIIDDTFTLDTSRLERFCEAIKQEKLDIVWKCGNGVRVSGLTKELLKLMKEAGCYSLAFGIESGNQKILDNIGKKITLEESRNAIKLCKEVGIFTVGFFMLGNLGENEETMKQTIEFAKSLNPDVAQFMILVPYPGTKIGDIIEKEGKILVGQWRDYANISGRAIFEHGELTKPLMERMYQEAYREFYWRPSYLLRSLTKIRGLYDLKTYVRGFWSILRRS